MKIKLCHGDMDLKLELNPNMVKAYDSSYSTDPDMDPKRCLILKYVQNGVPTLIWTPRGVLQP